MNDCALWTRLFIANVWTACVHACTQGVVWEDGENLRRLATCHMLTVMPPGSQLVCIVDVYLAGFMWDKTIACYVEQSHWCGIFKQWALLLGRIACSTTLVSQYQKSKNQSGFKWGKRLWGFGMTVASAGPYANNLHLALQIDNHTNTSSLNFYRPRAGCSFVSNWSK